MKLLKIALVAWLVLGLSVPAMAGGPQSSGPLQPNSAAIAKAVQQSSPPADRGPIPKQYLWPGAVLFAGGMALAFNGFLNNSNGKFPEPGEASATNVKMGAAGLATAFAGGALLLLGKRSASRSPSVTFDRGRLTLSKQISW